MNDEIFEERQGTDSAAISDGSYDTGKERTRGYRRENDRSSYYGREFNQNEYRPRNTRPTSSNYYNDRQENGGYGRRYNNDRGVGSEPGSYRDRFLAIQAENKTNEDMQGDNQPQRRRRMRISEVKAMEQSPEQRYERMTGGYQRYDNNYRRPYDNNDRGPQTRYSRQDRGNYDYRNSGYGDYERRGGYDQHQSGENASQQREYYKERYNQTRENYRQQYGDRPQYYNKEEGQYGQSRPRRPQVRRQFGGGNDQQGGYNRPNNNNGRYPQKPQQRRQKPAQKFTPKPTPVVYEDDAFDINAPIRLNKFLANSGVCSRREADELIQAGAVLVNDQVVTELGTKITMNDAVLVNGKEVKPENKVYVLLNKPRNCVTTSEDPQERLTVLHLVKNACRERIYPVGRLDRNTTGVLLLTNDGDLASKLVHPSFKKKKIYHVWLDKEVSIEDMQKIADGIELEDGEMHADAISYASEEDHTQVGIEIHSGRNRIVRRIFEHLGYHVYKLDRVYFAGLTKKNLGRGKWRYLTQDEVNMLRMGAFE